MTWQGHNTRLSLHYEKDFTLYAVSKDTKLHPEILWHYPYEKLRTTGDDGIVCYGSTLGMRENR